jgi:hypothetical protein
VVDDVGNEKVRGETICEVAISTHGSLGSLNGDIISSPSSPGDEPDDQFPPDDDDMAPPIPTPTQSDDGAPPTSISR